MIRFRAPDTGAVFAEGPRLDVPLDNILPARSRTPGNLIAPLLLAEEAEPGGAPVLRQREDPVPEPDGEHLVTERER